MNKNRTPLIGSYEEGFDSFQSELLFEDFISREYFINQTGIYISTIYFPQVYEKFKKCGVTVDAFVANYEKKYATCINEISLRGLFKFEAADSNVNPIGVYLENDSDSINIFERINALDMTMFLNWKTAVAMIKKHRKEDQ